MATCHVTKNEKDSRNKLIVRPGAGQGASSSIFTVIVDPDKVTIYFEDGERLNDTQGLLKGTTGKRYLAVNSQARLKHNAVSVLFERAVRESRKPPSLSGRTQSDS
jgi:hypothetical protein